MNIDFFVHGTPAPKGSIKAFMPKGWKRPILTSDTGPRLKSWAQSISVMALSAREGKEFNMESAVEMTIHFYMARPKSAKKRQYVTVKPDVDKLVRAALDPLIGILFKDDSQVVSVNARKLYADDPMTPGAHFYVSYL